MSNVNMSSFYPEFDEKKISKMSAKQCEGQYCLMYGLVHSGNKPPDTFGEHIVALNDQCIRRGGVDLVKKYLLND